MKIVRNFLSFFSFSVVCSLIPLSLLPKTVPHIQLCHMLQRRFDSQNKGLQFVVLLSGLILISVPVVSALSCQHSLLRWGYNTCRTEPQTGCRTYKLWASVVLLPSKAVVAPTEGDRPWVKHTQNTVFYLNSRWCQLVH